jgi:DNA (cytosine-5)-methyltransferase 1
MTHGSLFSGIGGFDLAAEWMGWENVFHCEWNPFGQKVLHHYWPNAISYNDITKTDFTLHRGTIDILTGGFPCQPYSMAGKRLGKEDERHLWPEMLRAIREIQPRWIVGENVLGLVNWSDGLVFHEVQTDLEAEGYEVQPFVLPACAVNAAHRRDRVWFVAKNTMRSGCTYGESIEEGAEIWQQRDIEQMGESDVTDASHSGFQRGEINGSIGGGRAKSDEQSTRCVQPIWENFPTQSPVCDGNDGLPSRLDGITFSKWRQESIKAGGNAVVPQVVYQIFKAIQEYENNF